MRRLFATLLKPRPVAPPPAAPRVEPALQRAALAGPAKVILLPPPAMVTPDPRHISPRDFAEFTHELYMEGQLSWEEYQLVGFPSELDPRWDETIGALTGEKAEPDRPRDMLTEWERRVDFERRYNRDPVHVARAERVLALLRREAGE